MAMSINDKPGFWSKVGNWLDPMEYRDFPLTQEGPGSVNSVGGTSPLMGVVPAISATNPPTWDDMVALIGEEPSAEQALSIGVVARGVDIITTSLSQMEVGVYRAGVEIPIKYDNSNLVIRQPSPDVSIEELIQESTNSLAVYGNAYWLIDGEGKNISARIVSPDSVTISRDEKGRKFYQFPTFSKPIPAKDVIHLKHTRRPGHDLGYGPLQLGQSEIKAALMLRDFQNKWMGNRIMPEMYLKTDQVMSLEDQIEMSQEFARMRKNHPELPPVVSQGLSIESMRIRPAEVQLLEVMKANDLNLARLLGVPPYHLGVEIGGNSTTYTNLEGLQLQFLQTTLVRYMNEIERALGRLLPYGQKVQFKEEGLLRTDTVTKWNILKTQTEIGYTNGNELRKVEGKAPLLATAMPKANPVTKEEDNEQ